MTTDWAAIADLLRAQVLALLEINEHLRAQLEAEPVPIADRVRLEVRTPAGDIMVSITLATLAHAVWVGAKWGTGEPLDVVTANLPALRNPDWPTVTVRWEGEL